MRAFRWAAIAALFDAAIIAPRAEAQDDFFKGRTITIYVGYGSGGGFDLFARFAAHHIGRHIPGEPTVVVQNMPGAGSIRAANFVFNAAPKDGTALGLITPTVALEEALGTAGVKFKAAEFIWIGRVAPLVDLSVTWNTSKVKTIADARLHEAAMAASGPGSTSVVYLNVLNRISGTKFKVITGYSGSTEGMLAMERGETDGAMTSWSTLTVSKADWLKQKKVNILVQYVGQRIPELPDVPTLIDLGKTPEEKQLFALLSSGAEIGRSVMAPPGLPADRAKTLRAAFDAMVKDREFIADVERAGEEFNPMSGDKLQGVIAAAVNIPETVKERAREARGM